MQRLARSTIESSSTPSAKPHLATAPVPLPPPADLPEGLVPLHAFLSMSPFLDKGSITFINAREADPDSWTDFVVVTTLKSGREGGLRGAVEGIRNYLAKNPVNTGATAADRPFAPSSTKPEVSGLPSSPSRHARSRKTAPTRAEQATGWGMVDCGAVVVHVQTADAREEWGIEDLWRRIKKENSKYLAEEEDVEA
ncbi:hypothetical protein MNV49_002790 [Pseudohyphozyma bogoriensis]|nr:hypothetical protein MNV49_002790 [Pseudohyphozyma bogoriensis]